ncbi:MAG: ABC transporter ATP-binding protein [Nitrospirae bacterium]|nr:ABC transporter ATP-binding protein [Nitrospirota bacterium]MBI5694450.1 ABC transporter ATP-binding protein [Nitrospirota bacterium]
MIRTENLCKVFVSGFLMRKVPALTGLSMEVRKGEVFGFLGPNGAGKTTTLKILMGLIYPSSGKAWIMGRELGDVDVKRGVGFLPEHPYFYDYLTANEFLDFYGRLFGLGRADRRSRSAELLRQVGLERSGDVQLRKFSKGMLQRIGIAQALINDPELVVLDEPMSGLDPIGRKEVRDIIIGLKDKGKTVFFSTHILPDVEVICDRVAILVKGELRATGTVAELLGGMGAKAVEMTVEGLGEAETGVLSGLAANVMVRGRQTVLFFDDLDKAGQAKRLVCRGEGEIVSLIPHSPSLEDLFLKEVRKGEGA